MAQALAQSKNWSSMNLLSVNIDSLLTTIGQAELAKETKIEDQTYIDNALGHMQLAKAFDLLDQSEQAYHKGSKALRTIEKLTTLRKEQGSAVNYESLLAPFYYKTGEFLVTYILLNTDELGTVRPFEEADASSDSEDEGQEGAEGDQAGGEEVKEEEPAPAEESKNPPAVAQITTMIDTTAGGAIAGEEEEKNEGNNAKDESDYEQEALNFLSLALQIIGDFCSNESDESKKQERKKLLAFLEIDTLLSRV